VKRTFREDKKGKRDQELSSSEKIELDGSEGFALPKKTSRVGLSGSKDLKIIRHNRRQHRGLCSKSRCGAIHDTHEKDRQREEAAGAERIRLGRQAVENRRGERDRKHLGRSK